MPLSLARDSLVNGAPRVVCRGGHVQVIQSPIIGWVMLGFGLGLPAAIAISEYGGIPSDLPTRLLHAWSASQGVALLGMAAFALLFGGLAAYGLFWLLWRRDLDIDLNVGRWRFVSGLPLARRRYEGRRDDAFVAQLRRQLRSSNAAIAGDLGNPMSGPARESWDLRLAIPGAAEPLFLGEWGEKAEALAEIEAWREILPRLAVEETGSK